MTEQATMHVFVTGGTGFIGHHVIQRLTECGHEVRALCRDASPLPSGVTPVRGDLEAVSAFAGAVAGCEAVIHCAARINPITDAALADCINFRATVELARAAASSGVNCFIFISTIAAIGIRHIPGRVRPDVECRPRASEIYGWSKLRAERELLAMESRNFRVVVVRPPLVYGRGEHRNFLELTRAIDTGLFLIPGSGTNYWSYCHVKNLADALVLLLERHAARGIYHVADLPAITFREAVQTIAGHLGRRLLPLPFPLPVARIAAAVCEALTYPLAVDPFLSRTRLETLTSDFALDCFDLVKLGYTPTVTFDAGVAETIAWYRTRGMLRPR